MPPPPNGPQPGDPVVFSRFDGLKNTLQPERLGARDLTRALNVALDDSGQLSRRRGYTRKLTGRAHSLWTVNDGRVFAVVDDALGWLRPDYSFQQVRSGVGGDPEQGLAPLSYVQVGATLYFSGPAASGKIDLDTLTASPWGGADLWLSPVVNPTANLPAIRGQMLGRPPYATALAYFNGKIYLAQGKTVWSTELYLYDYVDKTRGFWPYEGQITMLGAVGDGVYVGTDEGLWFMTPSKDLRPEQAFGLMRRERVLDSPVIPGSMVAMPAELGNPPQFGLDQDTLLKVSIGFMTTTGFCVAQDGGQAYNLTETKFFFPEAEAAAAMYRRQDGMNQYVAAMRGSGDPKNNAAIGDHVEATIIRAGSRQNPYVGATES